MFIVFFRHFFLNDKSARGLGRTDGRSYIKDKTIQQCGVREGRISGVKRYSVTALQ